MRSKLFVLWMVITAAGCTRRGVIAGTVTGGAMIATGGVLIATAPDAGHDTPDFPRGIGAILIGTGLVVALVSVFGGLASSSQR